MLANYSASVTADHRPPTTDHHAIVGRPSSVVRHHGPVARYSSPATLAIPAVLAIAAGAGAATAVLPAWLPAFGASLAGETPKAWWYLSRASAFVAFALLWLSMALGLVMTNKLARLWPGGPAAYDVHQYTSLLGLAFAIFHALVLLGDRYAGYTLRSVLVPFAGVAYRPLWVGLGQIGFYLFAVVALSFYLRRLIGHRTWRLVHLLSFVVFLLALVHGLYAGTDSAALWARALYWTSGASLLLLTNYRVLATVSAAARAARGPKTASAIGIKRPVPKLETGH